MYDIPLLLFSLYLCCIQSCPPIYMGFARRCIAHNTGRQQPWANCPLPLCPPGQTGMLKNAAYAGLPEGPDDHYDSLEAHGGAAHAGLPEGLCRCAKPTFPDFFQVFLGFFFYFLYNKGNHLNIIPGGFMAWHKRV